MKINLKHILAPILLLLTAFVNFVSANNTITPPPAPPGGGGGGVGPGSPDIPIDMYQIALFVFAFTLIIYFYKKIKLSKV